MNPIYIEQLNVVLGTSLENNSKEITFWHKKILEAYSRKKQGTDINTENDITVMEIYVSALYAIIAIATFFRADFKSDITVEKRLNLKYLCFVSTEFFKAVFISNKSNSLWNKFESIFMTGNHSNLFQLINEINEASSKFRTEYFNSDKRNVSLHYDFNLDIVYKHLCRIDEEYEAQHIASILSILEPLCRICSLYLEMRHPRFNTIIPLCESDSYKQFRKTLFNNIYNTVGAGLQNFAVCLDKNMNTYHFIDKPQIKNLLSNESFTRITELRECIKLSVLLQYFYLDLGTAVRGYLDSENYYEQQLHVIRVNVIIYEGYKKIFLSQNNNNQLPSLWKQYIHDPILAIGTTDDIIEMEAVETILQDYSTNINIENLRHKYSHFRRNKHLYLIDLWSNVLTIDPIIELNKALEFLKLISRITELNKLSLEYFAQQEHQREQNKLLAPLEDIFAKAAYSCKTTEDREKLNKLKNEFSSMILEIFNKVTKV